MQFSTSVFQQKVIEDSPDCIKVLNFQGQVVYMNPGGLRAWEIDDYSQCLDVPWMDLFWQDEGRQKVREAVDKAKAGETGTFQEYCPTCKGTPKWWDVVVSPMFDSEGHITHLLAISRDITERKRADEALHFLAKASAILASSLDYETTLKQLTVLVLPTLADCCFFDLLLPDKTLRRVAWSHVPGSQCEQFDQIVQFAPLPTMTDNPIIQVLTSGQMYVAPAVDDALLWRDAVSSDHLEFLRALEINSMMILPLIARGRTIGALACCRTSTSGRYYTSSDSALATELAGRAALAVDNALLYQEAQEELRMRRQAEEERASLFAREQEALAILGHFFSLSPDFFCIIDFDGIFKQINPAFERFLGDSAHKFLGRPVVGWLHPGDHKRGRQELDLLIMGNISHCFEQRYRKKDGTYGWISWNSIPVPEVRLIYAVGRDISEQKYHEQQKEAFISMANHELRTPLTALRTYLQLAERRLKKLQTTSGMVSDEGHRVIDGLLVHLSGAMHQVAVETRLTGDLLDASRIQSGKLHIVLVECDLVNIVREVVEDCRSISPQRRIALELPAFSVFVMADADRVGQVINNYITNALKYSEEAHAIAIGIDIIGQDARVWVHDNGPGLSSEAQEHIWERFYQVEGLKGNPVLSGFGLGLGLHICKTLIERHSGKVGVESVPGRGSTFWFTLPLC